MIFKKQLARNYVYLVFLFFCIVIVGLAFFQNGQRFKKAAEDLDEMMLLLSQSLHDRLGTIDKLYYALEMDIDKDMEKTLKSINDTYMKKGNLDFDFYFFIKDNPYMNLYVIDDNLKIIKTTDEADLNLNFGDKPKFAAFLNYVKMHKGYYSERINLSTIGSEIKKYSYLTSGDGKYIFEAGYSMDKFNSLLCGDSFDRLSSDTVKSNKNVLDVTVYNSLGKSFNDKGILDLNEKTEKIKAFNEAKRSGKTVKYSVYADNNKVTYLYIPYKVKNALNTSAKFVVELKYTDRYIKDELNKIFQLQMFYIIISILIIGFMHFYFSKQFFDPFREILSAFDRVKNNDFSTRVHVRADNEIKDAANVFNSMVESIENLLREKKSAEKELIKAFEKSEKSYFETVMSFVNSLDAKDKYTGRHCERVMKLTMLLADHLNLSADDKKIIKFGSILHDIGKIGIQDSILNKPGQFTSDEYEMVCRHPQIGYNILKNIDFLKEANLMVLFHHERIDGKGYPKGLKGKEIPYFARMLSITDAFDAMTSKRIYRKQILTVEDAFGELRKNSDSQFDGELVELFINAYSKKYGKNLDQNADVIENGKNEIIIPVADAAF